MKCFFRLLLLASVPARAPIRGKARAFAALLLNISPLLVSVLVAGRRLQPWRGSRPDGAFQQCLGLYEGMTSNEQVTVLLELFGRKVPSARCSTAYCGLAGPKIGNTPALVWASWRVPRVAKSLGERSFSSSADRGHPIPTQRRCQQEQEQLGEKTMKGEIICDIYHKLVEAFLVSATIF